MHIGIVFFIRLSFLFWIFEAGAGSPCLCGDASTRGLHAPAPPLFDPFDWSRSRAKRQSLRRNDSAFSLRWLGGVDIKMAAAYRAEG